MNMIFFLVVTSTTHFQHYTRQRNIGGEKRFYKAVNRFSKYVKLNKFTVKFRNTEHRALKQRNVLKRQNNDIEKDQY